MSTDITVFYKLDGKHPGIVYLSNGSTVEHLKMKVKAAEEADLVGVGHNNLTVYDPSGTAEIASFTSMEDDPNHANVYVVRSPSRATLGQSNGELRCCFCIIVFYVLFEYGNTSLFRIQCIFV
jgi:hypothetical protein